MRSLYLILFPIFVVSGFCGVAYEVIWGKQFHLLLGHTTHAISAVLTAFMGGLALGSWLGGKLADRFKRPLLVYCLMEIGIALYALLFPTLLEKYTELFVVVSPSLTSPASELAFKFISSLALIIVPTTIMGATFPIFSKVVVDNLAFRGWKTGLLYCFNSLGGALGCLVCSFLMLETYGVTATTRLIAGLNTACGVISIFICVLTEIFILKNRDTAAAAETSEITEPDSGTGFSLWRIQAVFMISGFVAMLLEVTWTRLLTLIMGASIHSFAIMLFTFIIGLAIGSFIISSFVDRLANPNLAFSVCQLIIGIYILFTLPMFNYLPFWFIKFRNLSQSDYFLYLLFQFLTSVMVMGPVSLAFGATFPIVIRIAKMSFRNFGSAVGNLYFSNTIGCILGSSLTGLLILPQLGLRHTLELGIVLAQILAFISIIFLGQKGDVVWVPRKTVMALAMVPLFLIPALPDWQYWVLNVGSYFRLNVDELGEFANAKVLYYREGATATVLVFDWKGTISLKINGKSDGSTSKRDMLTQSLVGLLPISACKKPKNVLIIGMGTGTTLAMAARMPGVEKITCVEISPEVIEGARCFVENAKLYENDKRIKIVIDDARSFLLNTPEKYDVIISEPSNPWVAGIANLFTTEFFKLCQNRLNEEGCMLSWLQAYESGDDLYRMIVRTFLSVFPDAVLFFNTNTDTFMISRVRNPIRIQEFPDWFRDLMKIPEVAEFLGAYKFNDELSLASLLLLTNEQLLAYAGKGDVNSDDMQKLEYLAPRFFHVGRAVNYDFFHYLQNLIKSVELTSAKSEKRIVAGKMVHLAGLLATKVIPPEIPLSILDYGISLDPANSSLYVQKGRFCFKSGMISQSLDAFNKALEFEPENLGVRGERALSAKKLAKNCLGPVADKYLNQASEDLLEVLKAFPDQGKPWFYLAEIYRDQGKFPEMREALKKSLDGQNLGENEYKILILFIQSLMERNVFSEAAPLLDEIRTRHPDQIKIIQPLIDRCRPWSGDNQPTDYSHLPIPESQ